MPVISIKHGEDVSLSYVEVYTKLISLIKITPSSSKHEVSWRSYKTELFDVLVNKVVRS